MELAGALAGDGVDDAAGHAAVLRWSVRGDDIELLHGIDTESRARDRARASIGVVVDVNAIEAIAVLLRPIAADGELRSKTAREAGGCRRRSCKLGKHLRDSRIECGQRRPVTAVERQIARLLAVDDALD